MESTFFTLGNSSSKPRKFVLSKGRMVVPNFARRIGGRTLRSHRRARYSLVAHVCCNTFRKNKSGPKGRINETTPGCLVGLAIAISDPNSLSLSEPNSHSLIVSEY